MPIYLFECVPCNRQEELQRKMIDMNEPAQCPECNLYMQRRMTAATAVYTDGGHRGEYTKYGPRK